VLAFKIVLNGKRVATIGQEDMSILTTTVVGSRGNQENEVDDYVRLNLGGMSHELPEGFCQHYRWKNRNLNVGDRIEIEILETNEIDPPIKRYRSDHQVQEDPFTEEEARDLRYQDYVELKKEFEPDADA
jgi:hypothetical protein